MQTENSRFMFDWSRAVQFTIAWSFHRKCVYLIYYLLSLSICPKLNAQLNGFRSLCKHFFGIPNNQRSLSVHCSQGFCCCFLLVCFFFRGLTNSNWTQLVFLLAKSIANMPMLDRIINREYFSPLEIWTLSANERSFAELL